ncbi:MAG: DUF3160 domain-containing protein [Lachnospiraceae bacterium]|nr:DUF3160 domain-containing protein [Lachnospiraceae bacterium]
MKTKRGYCRILAWVLLMTFLSVACSAGGSTTGQSAGQGASPQEGNSASQTAGTDETGGTVTAALPRPVLLRTEESGSGAAPVTAQIPAITVEADLSNVVNGFNTEYWPDEAKQQLARDHFIVLDYGSDEFYGIYEMNRYMNTIANFVTVDSIMHTYHLYFAYLQKTVETNHLSARLQSLSAAMLEQSLAQFQALQGSEWEDAAKLNLTFFAVGNLLIDPSFTPPEEVAETAAQEAELILQAEGITASPMVAPLVSDENEALEDYSQYKVRSYYAENETLERYFRTMMWYGRRIYTQREETLDRAALLMTVAMADSGMEDWDAIYAVTSFFAGTSDDAGYYEYRPLVEAACGGMPEVSALPGASAQWDAFHALTAETDPPAINDVPTVDDDNGADDEREEMKGFRFMGQRFSLDAAVFQELIYSRVGEDSNGQRRMLPSALDLTAALGSETALEILTAEGETGYQNYMEHMEELRKEIRNMPESSWSVSLSASWLNTLRPLLLEKGEGYPLFMQNENWKKKTLETFLGSWTELKHDTMLYAKQVMAEMGGGPLPEYDDRGYVEPEPELYRRLALMTSQTAEGLKAFGMLSEEDAVNLERLRSLAEKLETISVKELKNESLTAEEYELILAYGGELEHFWYDAVFREHEGGIYEPRDFPAALVADIATDPNGSVLEVAIENPVIIYVIVPIDGEPHLTSGAIFSFYEFPWPMNDRLTDRRWRYLIGSSPDENGNFNWGENREEPPEKPAWTQDYRFPQR